MTNIIYLIGRLNAKPEKVTINKKEVLALYLKVTRSFKNKDGNYDNDVFYIEVPFTNIDNYIDCMNEGDLVGIKGHVEIRKNKFIVICEKLTFLAGKEKNND